MPEPVKDDFTYEGRTEGRRASIVSHGQLNVTTSGDGMGRIALAGG